MKYFPPNLDPKIYTASAFLIGFALIDDFSAAEQNAIGNWLITIGQVLENNSAFQQMMEARLQGETININSKQSKETGNPYINREPLMKNPKNSDDDLDKLKAAIKIIQEQLNNMQ